MTTFSMTREAGQVVVPWVSRTIEPACRYEHFFGGVNMEGSKAAASHIRKAIERKRTGEVIEMSTKEHTTIRRARVGRQPVVPAALLLAFVFFTTVARGQAARVEPGVGGTAPEAGDVAGTARKNAKPL